MNRQLTYSAPASQTVDALAVLKMLPALPAVVMDLLRVSNDPFATMDDVAKVIEVDPAVTARVLSVANAAYFSPKEPITSVFLAITQSLGLDLTRGLVVGLAVQSSFDSAQCTVFDANRYWQSALLTASLSHRLAVLSDVRSEQALSKAYTTGLLNRLGLFALCCVCPSVVESVMLDDSDQPLSFRFQQKLALDHYDAGRMLADHWQLPKEISDTMVAADSALSAQHSSVILAREIADCVVQAQHPSEVLNSLVQSPNVETTLEALYDFAVTQLPSTQVAAQAASSTG